ncbi:N-acetyltransferase [Zobellella aerophila]
MFRLEQAAFGEHGYPDFFFRQALDLWPELLLVAESPGGELAGYCLGGVGTVPGQGWVLSLAVADAYRGAGIAGALLQRLFTGMAQAGCRQWRLTVAPESPAVRLYQRLGFEQEQRVPDYFGPGQSRLVLVRRE